MQAIAAGPALALICLMIASPAAAVSLLDDCESYRGNGLVRDRIERPSPPDCLRFPLAPADAQSVTECRSQVTQYLTKLDGYLKCLRWEADAAIDEYNDTAQRFNTLAK